MANTAETVKATTDRMVESGNKAFKETLDKSLSSLSDMNTHSKHNLEAMVAAATAASKGAESLGAQALAFSKKAMEDQSAAVRSLTSAKSLQEAVELQTAFAKSSMEAYLGEMNRWSETVSHSVRESLRPINERVSAMVDQFQSTR